MKSRIGEGSLFWSWGAFVFLSVNFLTGVLISNNATLLEGTIAIFIGFIILSLATFPVVVISVVNKLNYSGAIKSYVNNNLSKNALIILVPLINIGWYSIQVAVVVSILCDTFPIFGNSSLILSIIVSFIFSTGSFLFGYDWLRHFGAVAVAVLIITFSYSILQYQWHISAINMDVDISNIFNATVLVVGSWIFSSVTCLMDITNYVKNYRKAFIYVISALFLADITLIFIGFITSKIHNIDSMDVFLSIGSTPIMVVGMIISIWSTNDSNFFSTMRALEAYSIKKWKIYICISFLSGAIASIGQNKLFEFIGDWLILMGWIGIPIAIFWYIIYFREKKKSINKYAL